MGLLGSVPVLTHRLALERANRSVEVVLDLPAVEELARARGLSPESLLLALRERYGFEGVAVYELKLDELTAMGAALPLAGLELAGALRSGEVPLAVGLEPDPSKVYLVFFKRDLYSEVTASLRNSLGEERVVEWAATPDVAVLELAVAPHQLRTLGLGFSETRVGKLGALGFRVWLRPENRPGLTEPRVGAMFEELQALQGVEGVIFSGAANEAVGYPEALEETAQMLRATNWKIGYIELAPGAQQKGIETLVRSLPERTVRVLAVSPAHQEQLSPYRVASMYSLGARERNIRVLYVRPFPEPGGEKLNEELFQELRTELAVLGAPDTFGVAEGPLLTAGGVMAALAAAAASWILLGQFFPVPSWLGWLVVLSLPGLTLVAEAAGRGQTWRSLVALGAACVFATLATTSQFPLLERLSGRTSLAQVLPGSVLLLFRASAVALVGGLLVATLLHETTFLLGLDRFRGVKLLTLGVPVATVALLWWGRGGKEQAEEFFRSPLRVYHVVVLAVLSAVGVVYLLRTGNDSAGTALDFERVLRVYLDQLLGVRPRFKEFLVAHPAMVVAPVLAWTGRWWLVWLALLAGAVGQAGIVDTFAHVHTPLVVSIIRAVLGTVLGAALGLLVALVAGRLLPRAGTEV